MLLPGMNGSTPPACLLTSPSMCFDKDSLLRTSN